jgi:penicillin amidase
MPRVFDPPQGYIVTANQRIIGDSFKHPVATEWVGPWRARRIAELIEATPKHDRDSIEAIQLDAVSIPLRDLAQLWRPQLTGQLSALLENWDGGARRDDRKMLAAELLRRSLQQELREALNAGEVDWYEIDAPLLSALRASAGEWRRAGLGDKTQRLAHAAQRAADQLSRERARTWGEFDRTQIHHPFGLGGGALAWLFDPPQFDQSGCGSCPRVGRPAFGQSMRFVIDWSDPRAATLVLPLGQSGHLGSPHRLDMQRYWLDGDAGGSRTRLAP